LLLYRDQIAFVSAFPGKNLVVEVLLPVGIGDAVLQFPDGSTQSIRSWASGIFLCGMALLPQGKRQIFLVHKYSRLSTQKAWPIDTTDNSGRIITQHRTLCKQKCIMKDLIFEDKAEFTKAIDFTG